MKSIFVAIERNHIGPVSEIACPICRVVLDIHQPDPELPDRMLGTCSECKAWSLIDLEREIIVQLPVDSMRLSA